MGLNKGKYRKEGGRDTVKILRNRKDKAIRKRGHYIEEVKGGGGCGCSGCGSESMLKAYKLREGPLFIFRLKIPFSCVV